MGYHDELTGEDLHEPKPHGASHTNGTDDIQDATASSKGLMTATQAGKLDGISAGADVTKDAIFGAAYKLIPVDADEVGFIDSAASYVLKKLTWSHIKATLKTYFDALYSAVGHWHRIGTSSSIGLGQNALVNQTTGNRNTAIGSSSGHNVTSGDYSVFMGTNSGLSTTTGSYNTIIGGSAFQSNINGHFNTVLGFSALSNKLASDVNVSIGARAGNYTADGSTPKTGGDGDIYIGADSKALDNTSVGNEIVIGHWAVGHGANTVTLGNDGIVDTYLKGRVHANIPWIGFKNRIIGGDFWTNPWQRGTSFFAVGSGDYTADRWCIDQNSDAIVTVSRAADCPSVIEAGVYSPYCLSFDVATADTIIGPNQYCVLQQNIEGYNIASLGFGKSGTRYITLSFWVKATKTGIYCLAFKNNYNDRSYIAEYTINGSGVWEKKTITIPVDTSGEWEYNDLVGLKVCFTLAAGTDFRANANSWQAANYLATTNQVNALDLTANNFSISLVQLEPGEMATEFEQRSVQQELALCQRYYELFTLGGENSLKYGVPDDAGYFNGSHSFLVYKRTKPTVGVFSGTWTFEGCTTPGFWTERYSVTNYVSVTAAQAYRAFGVTLYADAEL